MWYFTGHFDASFNPANRFNGIVLLLETRFPYAGCNIWRFFCVCVRAGGRVCTFVCVQICLMLPKLDSNTLTREFKVMVNHFIKAQKKVCFLSSMRVWSESWRNMATIYWGYGSSGMFDCVHRGTEEKTIFSSISFS